LKEREAESNMYQRATWFGGFPQGEYAEEGKIGKIGISELGVVDG